MKFWELISAFRSEQENLKAILDKTEWNEFKGYYLRIEDIAKQQNRTILDGEVPFKLAKEICEKSKLEFYLYYESSPQTLTVWRNKSDEKFEILNSLDVLLRYGGNVIEETLEKSVTKVNPLVIGDRIQVLGAFNISDKGILAILRSENKLEQGEIICSENMDREWRIIEEPMIRMTPLSAVQKKDNQVEQGIRQYFIQPINKNDKPVEMEILKKK